MKKSDAISMMFRVFPRELNTIFIIATLGAW